MASNNPFDDSSYNRANNISSLSKVLSDNQRRTNKTMNELNKSISTTVKNQRNAINEVGYSKGSNEVEKSMNLILKKLGYVIEEFGKGAKKIVTQTAVATKQTLGEYRRAISDDINVNKTNLMAMSLARSTPIFGYFAAKFMETNVFKRAKDNISKSLSSVFNVVITKFKDLFSKGKGVFKDWWGSKDKIDNFFKGMDKILKFPFEKAGQVLRFTWESLKYIVKLPFKAIGAAIKGIGTLLKTIIALPFKSLAWIVKLPFKLIGGLFHGLGGGNKSIPKMASGGIVKKEGLAHLHPAEVVAPVKVLEKMFLSVSRPLNELRLFLIGPRMLGFFNFYSKMITAPLNWLFRPRGGYFSHIPHHGSVFEKTAITLGLIYTATQPKLDAIVKILQNIGEALTGVKQPGPSTSTWTMFGALSTGKILSELKAKGVFGIASGAVQHELFGGSTFKERAGSAVGKVKQQSSEAYLSAVKKVTDVFKKAPPEQLSLDLESGEVTLKSKVEAAYTKTKQTVGDAVSSKEGRKKVVDSTRKAVRDTYNNVKKVNKTELVKGQYQEFKQSDIGKSVHKAKKNTGTWVHRHITGVSPEGLIEALGFVVSSFVGVVGGIVNGAVGAFGFALHAFAFTVTKALSMSIRTTLMLIRGVSKLTAGLFHTAQVIATLPMTLTFALVTKATKLLTSGIVGGLQRVSGIMDAVTSAGGVGKAISAWMHKGEGTAEEQQRRANQRERKKTGVEGELQRIRHSLTEFKAAVTKQWAGPKRMGVVQSFNKMVLSFIELKTKTAEQWKETKKSYQDMHNMYKEQKGIREDAKKSGIWEFIKGIALWFWTTGEKLFDGLKNLLGFGSKIGGAATMAEKISKAGVTTTGGIVGSTGKKGGKWRNAYQEHGIKGKAEDIAISMAAVHAVEGALNASDWGVSKGAGAVGAVIGGNSSGVEGALIGGIQGAALAAAISPNPAGILAGTAAGAILGYIGGKNIAQFIDKSTNWIKGLFGYGGPTEEEKKNQLNTVKPLKNDYSNVNPFGDAVSSEYLKKRKLKNLSSINADDVFESSEFSNSKEPSVMSRAIAKVREILPKTINSMISGFTGVNVSNAMRSLPDANVNMLQPDVLKSLTGLSAEFFKTTGRPLTVNSAFRSRAQQEQLFASKPGYAARPGSSLHEYGEAVDIHSADADLAQNYGLLDKYGFVRPMTSKEPWHIQPKGMTLAKARESGGNQMGDPQFDKKSIAKNKTEYYNQIGDWMDQSIKATKDSAGTLHNGFVKMGDSIVSVVNNNTVSHQTSGNNKSTGSEGYSGVMDDILKGNLN